MDKTDAVAELTEELFARCEAIEPLDAPQIEGFVSGLFAAWDDEAEALAFVDFCRAHPGTRAAVVCAGLAAIDEHAAIGIAARRVFDTMASQATEEALRVGGSIPAQAWRVAAPFGSSLVIGFASDGARVDHAVLAEIDDDVLVDLQLTGAPDELLEAEGDDGAARLQVTDVEIGEAMRSVAHAWNAAQGRVEASPGMLANQRLVRARLRLAIGDDLPLFASPADDVDVSRGMSEAEVGEADRAALSTLQAALGDPPVDGEVRAAWVEVVRATVPGLTPREREALLWLEWADWLGVGIGLVRGLGDATVDGSVFVDLVNRCPEVSSTIHGDDRDYAEWAFEVAIEHLADAGLVEDGALTESAKASLHASLIAAWSR